jgi:hypothetical protein
MPLLCCSHLKEFTAGPSYACGRLLHNVIWGLGFSLILHQRLLLQGVRLRPGYFLSVGHSGKKREFDGNKEASLLLFTCQVHGKEPASTQTLLTCQSVCLSQHDLFFPPLRFGKATPNFSQKCSCRPMLTASSL